ncbi:MAG: DUF3467 domain-containing protein [Sphingomonadales bacterium]|jgi:hypothetical protein
MENTNTPIDIEISDEVADGTYSNFAIITHSNTEVILDFVRLMPGVPKGKVKSRIILAPQHAKRLLFALGDNIAKFEHTFGEIELDENESNPTIPLNFGGQTGQA